MSLKKLFYGIFDAPVWQAFKTDVIGDVADVDAKVQTIIDTPVGGEPIDLTPLSNQVTALATVVGVLFTLTPMAVWTDPKSGTQNDVISIPIMVHLDKLKEFEAFGFEVNFDSAYFQFMGVERGTLTSAWTGIDGNEDTPGHLIVGGFMGSTDNLSEDEFGSIVNLNFAILGGSGTSDVVMHDYIDDMKSFLPNTITSKFSHL